MHDLVVYPSTGLRPKTGPIGHTLYTTPCRVWRKPALQLGQGYYVDATIQHRSGRVSSANKRHASLLYN